MDILFKTQKLEKECNNHKLARRRYGDKNAKLLRRRLDDLQSSSCLEVLRTLPQMRCHELVADRKWQLAVDLIHPKRLIFKPANEQLPTKPDGGLDWTKVTAIQILEITDYH